jgi:hypothetical protein
MLHRNPDGAFCQLVEEATRGRHGDNGDLVIE